jgi:hypothetical protein
MTTYHPLDHLILFDTDTPRPGWVTSGKLLHRIHIVQESNLLLHIAAHEKDAQAGQGYWLDTRKVRPWTAELWAACEAWIRRREQLQKDFPTLARGKTPVHQGQLKLE